VDTELGARDLLNNRMAYVSVSRGAHDAQIFTNDHEKLPAALGHDVSHESAHVPEHKPEQSIMPQRQEIAHGTSTGRALDLVSKKHLPRIYAEQPKRAACQGCRRHRASGCGLDIRTDGWSKIVAISGADAKNDTKGIKSES
jgi:hypothetical protein